MEAILMIYFAIALSLISVSFYICFFIVFKRPACCKWFCSKCFSAPKRPYDIEATSPPGVTSFEMFENVTYPKRLGYPSNLVAEEEIRETKLGPAESLEDRNDILRGKRYLMSLLEKEINRQHGENSTARKPYRQNRTVSLLEVRKNDRLPLEIGIRRFKEQQRRERLRRLGLYRVRMEEEEFQLKYRNTAMIRRCLELQKKARENRENKILKSCPTIIENERDLLEKDIPGYSENGNNEVAPEHEHDAEKTYSPELENNLNTYFPKFRKILEKKILKDCPTIFENDEDMSEQDIPDNSENENNEQAPEDECDSERTHFPELENSLDTHSPKFETYEKDNSNDPVPKKPARNKNDTTDVENPSKILLSDLDGVVTSTQLESSNPEDFFGK